LLHLYRVKTFMAIYLDHNAGSMLRPEAAAAISRFLAEAGGNPSSVHRTGQRSRRMLERARVQVASLVAAEPRQIFFTSGGTESNNLAIFGAMAAAASRRRVISSEIEHSSILTPLADLQRRGFDVVRVTADTEGRIDPARITSALSRETALVTLGLANSEVGTIQNLAPVAAAIRESGAALHIDAAQAAGRVPVDVGALGCDLMTISGHKFGAPAGIGALYVRDPARVSPVMLGGPQENGLRAGTPNLLGAIAMGACAQAVAAAIDDEQVRIGHLAETLFARLRESIAGLRLNGPDFSKSGSRIPNTLNLTFPDVLGESMLIALDLEGVEVSMGSACAAGAVEPSHVLRAMDRSPADARSSLRISLGWSTTARDIDTAANIISSVWRAVSTAEGVAGVDAR
jgi:cysteine desulfurase